MNTINFIPQIDRFDLNRAAVHISEIIPNAIQRIACMKELSKSILEADSLSHDNWELSLFNNKIRLNVGQVEVITIYKEGIRFIFADPIVTNAEENYEITRRNGPYYRSVPIPSGACLVSFSQIGQISNELRSAHARYISEASSRKKGTAWKEAFSPSVILYIQMELKEQIPFPGYYKNEKNWEALQIIPEEVRFSEKIFEGAKYQINVNVYERDPNARKQCISAYGPICSICGFEFEKVFGNDAKGYIHVHHLRPLSTIGEKYVVDPIEDLRPVCPNCHAVIHMRTPPFTIEELKSKIKQRST